MTSADVGAPDLGNSADCPAGERTNLALCGTPNQSSLCFDGPAAEAIDGILSGPTNWSHTCDDAYAWWDVDLATTAQIEEVVVWNRSDCCIQRLNDFYVQVSTVPFPDGLVDPATTTASVATTVYSEKYNGAVPLAPLDFSFTPNVQGRYVRITNGINPVWRSLGNDHWLHLAEVQVFGVK